MSNYGFIGKNCFCWTGTPDKIFVIYKIFMHFDVAKKNVRPICGCPLRSNTEWGHMFIKGVFEKGTVLWLARILALSISLSYSCWNWKQQHWHKETMIPEDKLMRGWCTSILWESGLDARGTEMKHKREMRQWNHVWALAAIRRLLRVSLPDGSQANGSDTLQWIMM